MASSVYDPSVSGILLIVVFQLGICIILLATVANGAQGYGTLTGSAGYLIGGATAAGALLAGFQRRSR